MAYETSSAELKHPYEQNVAVTEDTGIYVSNQNDLADMARLGKKQVRPASGLVAEQELTTFDRNSNGISPSCPPWVSSRYIWQHGNSYLSRLP